MYTSVVYGLGIILACVGLIVYMLINQIVEDKKLKRDDPSEVKSPIAIYSLVWLLVFYILYVLEGSYIVGVNYLDIITKVGIGLGFLGYILANFRIIKPKKTAE